MEEKVSSGGSSMASDSETVVIKGMSTQMCLSNKTLLGYQAQLESR